MLAYLQVRSVSVGSDIPIDMDFLLFGQFNRATTGPERTSSSHAPSSHKLARVRSEGGEHLALALILFKVT